MVTCCKYRPEKRGSLQILGFPSGCFVMKLVCVHRWCVLIVLLTHLSSAKKYLAPDAQPLRQDTRHRIWAPMTPGAFYGWLPHFLAPGASGETVAMHYYIWTLVVTQPSLQCFLTQLTIPSFFLIHHLFSLHPDFPIAFLPFLIC